MQAKHAVRLHLGASGYNALIAALTETQSSGNDVQVERSNALLAKITKYARFYEEDDADCAELRFFESEAKNLILLLLQAYAYHSPDNGAYYHDHAANGAAE